MRSGLYVFVLQLCLVLLIVDAKRYRSGIPIECDSDADCGNGVAKRWVSCRDNPRLEADVCKPRRFSLWGMDEVVWAYATKSCWSSSTSFPALFECNTEFGFFCDENETTVTQNSNFDNVDFSFRVCKRWDTPIQCEPLDEEPCGSGFGDLFECRPRGCYTEEGEATENHCRVNKRGDDCNIDEDCAAGYECRGRWWRRRCMLTRDVKNMLRNYTEAACETSDHAQFPPRVQCLAGVSTCDSERIDVILPGQTQTSFWFKTCIANSDAGDEDTNTGGEDTNTGGEDTNTGGEDTNTGGKDTNTGGDNPNTGGFDP